MRKMLKSELQELFCETPGIELVELLSWVFITGSAEIGFYLPFLKPFVFNE